MKAVRSASIRFSSIGLALCVALAISCHDDNVNHGYDYVHLSASRKPHEYRYSDSLFQRCELHVGSVEKFVFLYEQTFKSNDADFYCVTMDINCSAEHCPETTIDDACQFSVKLVKQNASKQFVDFVSKPNLNINWTQRFGNSSIIVTGTFSGYLYQYFKTRPSGAETPPAPMLLDSVYVDQGEFQVSIPH